MSTPEPATATRCCSGSMLQGLQTRCTPQVQLVLHRTDGRRQQTAWTPDTGAEVSVTSLDEATRMGINVKDLAPPASSLFTADGRELPCLGSCHIVLQLGDIKRTRTVSVVKKLHSSLLSWHDAVHLGILHREFPKQIRFVTSEAQEGQGSSVGGQETEPRRSRIPRRYKATTSTPSGSTQTKTTLKDLRKPTGVGQGSPVGAQKAGPGRSRIPRRCTGAASKLSGSTQTDTTLKDQRKPTWDDRRTQPSLQEQEKHDAEAEKDSEHRRASLIASLISTAPAEEPEGSPFPSQQKEPLIMEATPTMVFETVSADYFSWAGRAYLVYADRLSGWPFVFHCTGGTSARELVSSLRLAFAATGAPSTLRTDGGSQFAARQTRDLLRRWGVTHQVSTPHFPQSSGHAEAAVKAVKRLVQKVCTRGDIDTDELQQGLLELRNSARADGLSPAQVLYGRPLRSAVPAHHRAFADVWQRAAEECDEKAAVKSHTAEYYDRSARSLRSLRVSQQVLLQDPKTGLWDRTGTIVGLGNRRDCLIRLPSGRTYRRNRRYLRPLRPLVTVSPCSGGNSSGNSSSARADSSGAAGYTRRDDKAQDQEGTKINGSSTSTAGNARSGRPGDDSAAPMVPVRRSSRRRQRPKKLSVNWSDPVYEYV